MIAYNRAMHQNTRSFLFALAAVTILATAGCGGLGGSSSSAYQGTWKGDASVGGTSGTMTLTVDSSGNFTGTDTVTSPGNTATDTGTIDGSGNLSLTSTFNGTRVATVSGTIFIPVANFLTTSGSETPTGGTAVAFTFNLAKQ